jgi:hypothetical protein
MARVGLFIPNGKGDQAHRNDATLLAADHEVGSSAAKLMLDVPGH